MWQKMLQVGSGGDTFPTYEKRNATEILNRVTIDEGGYFIKDGMCYVDIICTANATTSSNQSIIQNLPIEKGNSSPYLNYYNATTNAYVKVGQNICSSGIMYIDGGLSSGTKYRIVGMYLTSEVDTQ